MTSSPFKFSRDKPVHLSVGLFPVGSDGRVACHYHLKRSNLSVGKTLYDFVRLATETVEEGETLEDCAKRGLREELGLIAERWDYVGATGTTFQSSQGPVEKTVLHFVMWQLSEVARSGTDSEAESVVSWYSLEDLVRRFRQQASFTPDGAFDESRAIALAANAIRRINRQQSHLRN